MSAKRSGVLQTAEAMGGLDATTDTFKAGKLSRRQANAVATAAEADPGKENELLNRAAVEPVTGLEKKARDIRLAASPETRRATPRPGPQGTDGSRPWRTTTAATAAGTSPSPTKPCSWPSSKPAARRSSARPDAEGRRESHEAYMADALLSLLDTASSHDQRETRSEAPSASRHQGHRPRR